MGLEQPMSRVFEEMQLSIRQIAQVCLCSSRRHVTITRAPDDESRRSMFPQVGLISREPLSVIPPTRDDIDMYLATTFGSKCPVKRPQIRRDAFRDLPF